MKEDRTIETIYSESVDCNKLTREKNRDTK